jgi:SAM-dependent methyltransferase
VGRVEWGDYRQLEPISRQWGGDRGQPVDRYYIEKFLQARAGDIRGRVLEVGGDVYIRRFGGDRVERAEVVVGPLGDPSATFVADFADAPQLPADAFDCIICTQTLQFIADPPAAVATLYRILKPGGVLLATVPGISQIDRAQEGRWNELWRFTVLGCQGLLESSFSPSELEVEAHGNVLSAVAFLEGLAADELTPEELDHNDPDYQVLIAVRAIKEPRGHGAISPEGDNF